MMSKTMFRFTDVWVHSAHSTTLAAFSPLAPRQTTLSLWQQWSNKVLKTQAQAPLSSAHRRLLVKGASGALSSGQVTVLTGPSGSGKSILLQTLAGLLPMSCGEVFLHGEGVSNKLAPWSIHHTAPVQWRTQVALLTQHPQLLEGCVLDNLKMPYRLQAHQHLSFDIKWHITQLKHLQRDARFLQKNTHHLSGGERQLTHTLRLLQLNPQVLLLDEPTAALDVVTSAQLIQLLTNWLRSDKRRTLLWVTHDTKDIMPHASQHWQMQAGVLTDIVV